MAAPRILLLDIETAPILVYCWGLWDQNVAINQIVEPGHTLCFAAQWLGESKVHFHSVWKDGKNKMVRAAHKLLEEADIIIHYNGKKFDIPMLNREFLLLGLTPPMPAKQIDLLEVVKRRFRFPSNKLDFVVQALGIGAKTVHKGMDLWRGCMHGVKADQSVMEEYNRQDTNLLGLLYNVLLPWIPNHPNLALYTDLDKPVCNHCGSTHIQHKGTEPHSLGIYVRMKCMKCGTPLRGGHNLLSKKQRANLLREVR